MKKLVCDRCGRELSNPEAIDLVLKGREAWQNSVRARGKEPRGIFPCEYYIQCEGEMVIVDANEGEKGLSGFMKKLLRNRIV
ncbi:MAG: hypothetical protein JW712_12780 [Dehalococcoidales bacterium]|nr:hypothetical protein [Dehalococcoidales bacterium]